MMTDDVDCVALTLTVRNLWFCGIFIFTPKYPMGWARLPLYDIVKLFPVLVRVMWVGSAQNNL